MLRRLSFCCGLALCAALALMAGEPDKAPPEKKEEKKDAAPAGAYPPWDGKEKVADYAKRVGLEPAVSFVIDLGTKIDLVLIPPGTFTMGSPKDEKGRDFDEKQHQVTISRPFYLGKFEVTQKQYESLIGNNPVKQGFWVNSIAKAPDKAVNNVSWEEALTYCLKLGQKLRREVRLPTEAEWEHACRAGTQTAYYTGATDDDLDRAGWCRLNAALGSKTEGAKKVGQKEPNAFGLYDMHGNMWEWVHDTYDDEYPQGPVTDPQGPAQGMGRVVRGGAWMKESAACRSANREWYRPSERQGYVGFRALMTVPPKR